MKIYNNDNLIQQSLKGTFTVAQLCRKYCNVQKLKVIDFAYFDIDDLDSGDYPVFGVQEIDVRQETQEEVVLAVIQANMLICVI